MSLFGGKDVTQVSTSVSRVVSDALVPSSIKSGLIKAVFADGDPSEYVMEELVSSIGLRAERMYRYADSKYIYGSPSGELYSNTQGRIEVEEILETEESTPIALQYSYFGPLNILHLGWMKLIESYGYDSKTNKLNNLTISKGTPVYLADIQVVIPVSLIDTFEKESLEQWGLPASTGYVGTYSATEAIRLLNTYPAIATSTTATAAELRVTYQWDESNLFFYEDDSGYARDSFTITITDLDTVEDYFHAKYLINDTPTYWLYKMGKGTYPVLDNLFTDSDEVSGQFFPFVYFRYGKQAMNLDTESIGYKASTKLLNYIGMDFDKVTTAIHENPDIADVEQAMMMMAVPPITENKIEQRYLFDFFEKLFYATSGMFVAKNYSNDYFLSFGNTDSKHVIVIKDALFKMALSHDGITKEIHTGDLGKVGVIISGTGSTSYTQAYTADDDAGGTTTQYITIVIKHHFYKKQVTSTNYEEIKVFNLRMVYDIWGGYKTTGYDADPILLVPIDHSITRKYSLLKKEELFSRSMHFVFNSRVTTHLKWYQTGLFGDLIFVASVVFFVYTGNFAAAAMVVAARINPNLALIVALFTGNLIEYLVVTVAIKFFVKVVGFEFAFLVVVIAMASGMAQAFKAGSLSGAPWAKELLNLASNIAKRISTEVQNEYKDLLADYKSFAAQLKKDLKLLETAQEQLDSDNHMSTIFIPGELPSDFFNRTLGANPGIQSIEAIRAYVTAALQLPKLSNTIERTEYV